MGGKIMDTSGILEVIEHLNNLAVFLHNKDYYSEYSSLKDDIFELKHIVSDEMNQMKVEKLGNIKEEKK